MVKSGIEMDANSVEKFRLMSKYDKRPSDWVVLKIDKGEDGKDMVVVDNESPVTGDNPAKADDAYHKEKHVELVKYLKDTSAEDCRFVITYIKSRTLILMYFSSEGAPIKKKMVASSTWQGVKAKCGGTGTIECQDLDDLKYDNVSTGYKK